MRGIETDKKNKNKAVGRLVRNGRPCLFDRSRRSSRKQSVDPRGEREKRAKQNKGSKGGTSKKRRWTAASCARVCVCSRRDRRANGGLVLSFLSPSPPQCFVALSQRNDPAIACARGRPTQRRATRSVWRGARRAKASERNWAPLVFGRRRRRQSRRAGSSFSFCSSSSFSFLSPSRKPFDARNPSRQRRGDP